MMKPTLIADGSDAITNGFTRVFGTDYKRVMYLAHMRRAVDKKINIINDKDIEEEVMDDIEKLQLCQNIKIFENTINYFSRSGKQQKSI